MTCRIREVAPGDLDCLAGPAEQACELFERDDPAGRVLSIEKAWDGLHYLLTGSARGGREPLCFLRRGGRSVGRDLGCGRPRLLGADFVRRLDSALRDISDEELGGRFDAARFEAAGVYPDIWDEPEDQLREEYLGYFAQLKEFVGRAAARDGELLIVVI
ncbi:MAG TPA: YfbM family protein [Gemmataceae bacterium]|nr:YfbM family protein [Gemmataceae bacterium]